MPIQIQAAAAADLPDLLQLLNSDFPRSWSLESLQREFGQETSLFRLAVESQASPSPSADSTSPPADSPSPSADSPSPLGACVSSRLAGACLLWRAPDELHVLNVVIAPAYRRMGIGRALLRDVQGLARELHMLQVILEVRSSNKAAIALYEGLGFGQIGLRKKYYQEPSEDALVFLWEVGAS